MSKKTTKTGNEMEKMVDATTDLLDGVGGIDANSLKASSTFEQLLKSEGFETEAFVTMDEGDKILGYLIGKGANATVKQTDFKTKEEVRRPVSTWRFKHPTMGCIMRILGSPLDESGVATYGLDQDLAPIPLGTLVYVEKGEQEELGGGRRANKWKVACNPKKRLANIAEYVKAQPIIHAFPPHVTAGSGGANGAQTEEGVPF